MKFAFDFGQALTAVRSPMEFMSVTSDFTKKRPPRAQLGPGPISLPCSVAALAESDMPTRLHGLERLERLERLRARGGWDSRGDEPSYPWAGWLTRYFGCLSVLIALLVCTHPMGVTAVDGGLAICNPVRVLCSGVRIAGWPRPRPTFFACH